MARTAPMSDVSGEELLRRRLRRTVREHPLASMLAAGAAGAVLGGIVLSRLARLVFVAALGYVGNELLHRQGKLDVDGVIERLAR